jgi:DNA-binding transcriptional ArsR family regulator
MAIKKGKRLELDGAVEAAVTPTPYPLPERERGKTSDPVFGALERVKRARNQTPGQRRKAEKDAKRNRAMFDLPEELETALDEIATRLSVPRSQVASWLMLRGLEHTQIEELVDCRRPSRSMRYEFNLEDYPRLAEKWENED